MESGETIRVSKINTINYYQMTITDQMEAREYSVALVLRQRRAIIKIIFYTIRTGDTIELLESDQQVNMVFGNSLGNI